MNKKAFTIIELLSILVILGIILVIAVPKVMDLVKESQKNTLLSSSESLIRKIQQKAALNDMSNQIFIIENGAFVGNTLEVEGSLPTTGKIRIDDKNRISISMSNGKYCAIKNYTDDSITVSDNLTLCNLNTVAETTPPTIVEAYSGTMFYTDPNFSTGSNSMSVYNNLGNGLVTHTRVAKTTPVGSYVIRVTTSGAASPGLGGFVQNTVSRANAIFIHRIIAKIPVGYTINRASNSVGNTPQIYWITPVAGTGNWEEYTYIIKTTGTGTFSSFGHVYLTGTAPVTWDVAYSTIIDTGRMGTSASIIFKATDLGSGVSLYGINQSNVTPPTYKTVTTTSSLGTGDAGFITNATYYIWVKDAAGNLTKVSIPITTIQ